MDGRHKHFVDALESYLDTHDKRMLQLGCGEHYVDGWFNTDLDEIFGSSIYSLDMTGEFGVPDDTFDFIYTEHNIEHFTLSEGMAILGKCYRALKPGGFMRIATPDLNKLINIYLNGRRASGGYVDWMTNEFIPYAKKGNLYDSAVVLNNSFRDWGHKMIYDYKLLSELLKRSGFKDIKKCGIYKSQHVELCNMEKHLSHDPSLEKFNIMETMIVEAMK